MTHAAALRVFEDAIARFQTEREVGLALHRLTDALVGVKLLTLTAVNIEAGHVRRVYSSDEAAYPLLGTKPIVYDAWFEQMRSERRISVASDEKAMEPDFPDLGLIRSLGCGSAMNVPVMVGGELLGTINLLDVEHRYDAASADAAQALVVPATVCFLILRGKFAI